MTPAMLPRGLKRVFGSVGHTWASPSVVPTKICPVASTQVSKKGLAAMGSLGGGIRPVSMSKLSLKQE